jgi:hypothetical protein
MATNNDGHLLDSSSNVAVDFVYGPFPVQPNDERAASVSNTGGSTGDYGWAQTTKVASGRLNPALDNHANVEANYANYPSYTPAPGNFMVTAASGNGSVTTLTSQNKLVAGDTVDISGLSVSALNDTEWTVVSSNATSFTVSSSYNGTVTGQYGKVQYSDAADAGDGVGLGNIIVPNVQRLTTASAIDALKDAGFEAGNITTDSTFTPVISAITLTSNVASVTATGHGFAVGDVVVVAGLTNGGGNASADADLNGTHTITVVPDANNFRWAQTHGNIATHSGLSGNTAKVAAYNGKIYSQSTAPATAVSTGASITIRPYYAS